MSVGDRDIAIGEASRTVSPASDGATLTGCLLHETNVNVLPPLSTRCPCDYYQHRAETRLFHICHICSAIVRNWRIKNA
jgi:hypothetical protein